MNYYNYKLGDRLSLSQIQNYLLETDITNNNLQNKFR